MLGPKIQHPKKPKNAKILN